MRRVRGIPAAEPAAARATPWFSTLTSGPAGIIARVRRVSLLQATFFLYVIAGLVIMTYVVPPFQKPDEPAHYYRAVSVSNLDMTCTKEADGIYYMYMKRRYADLPVTLHVWDVAFFGDQRYDRDWLRADFSKPEFEEEVRVPHICNLPPIGYLPNTVGIWLGKPFENPLIGFYAARVVGALFFFVAMVWALAITPARYRLPVYFYCGLPVVFHQVTAISYDTMQLAFFPVLFGYVAKFAADQAQASRKHLLAFMAVLLVSVSIRSLSYLPLLGLFFAIAPSRIASSLGGYVKATGLFFMTATLVTLILSAVYVPRVGAVPVIEGEVSVQRQLEFLADDPLSIFESSYRTLQVQGEWMLRQTMGVYGWLDAPMTYFPYYLTVFVLGLVFYHTIREDMLVLGWRQVGMIFAVVAATIACLFVSLYLVWTPVGANIVLGLQGRYFIGLLPFTIFAASQLALLVGRQRFVNAMTVVLICILLYNMYRAVDLRYYG